MINGARIAPWLLRLRNWCYCSHRVRIADFIRWATRSSNEAAQPGGIAKRISAAIRSQPASIVQQRTQRSVGSLRGLDAIEEITNAGLTMLNGDGVRVPLLAEAVPTVDNGLWKVFPDGRMETTWKIKPNAVWHDGSPFTTADLMFTAAVEQDKELGVPAYPAYDSVETMSAQDASTITVTWKRPFIEADGMFGYRVAGLPIPKHLMESVYTDDRDNFLGHSYWSEQFVGLGAFKVQQWVMDSNVVLRANPQFVLGAPKISEIDVRFIADPTTLVANVLSGVDMTLGKTISLDQALQARDQWRDGTILTKPQNWTPISVQFINTAPSVVTQLPFPEGDDRGAGPPAAYGHHLLWPEHDCE